MFHKPIKKELSDLVQKRKSRPRLIPKPPPAVADPQSSTVTSTPNGAGTPSIATSISPSSAPKPQLVKPLNEPDDELVPTGKFADYQIVSTTSKGWKYNVMKFAEFKDKDVELSKWKQPIKLNRKDYRPPERSNGGNAGAAGFNGSGAGIGNEGEEIKKTPMIGPDGKTVIGPDGRTVMVGPDGKVIPSGGPGKGSANGGPSRPGKATTPNGKSKGKNAPRKKIKQSFIVSDEIRKLRREERYPWVIEEAPPDVKPTILSSDSNAVVPSVALPSQVWIGHLEDPDKNQTHALLIPSGTTFQFVTSHRFYRFTKRRMDVPGSEEAEAEYAKLQKSKDPTQLWKRRKRGALSEATLSTLRSGSQGPSQSFSSKNEDGDDGDFGDGPLRAGGGGDDIFGGDDDDEEKLLKKRRDKDLGQEGDLDEMEYEEEFADDDEKMDMDGDDEELREMEERLKREYRNANKMRDATIDDDEEDEEMEEINQLTGAGKDLKKLVKKTEKNDAYESDEDERNPYASEEEEEEEPPPPPVLEGPAVMNQQQPPSPVSGRVSPAPAPGAPPFRLTPTLATMASTAPLKQLPHVSSHVSAPSSPVSRPGSPLAGNLVPGMGNAIVAKRATSPKGGKSRSLGVNSAVGGGRSPSPSPLGAAGIKIGGLSPTRGRSPVVSRAGSPVPITTAGASLKRKAVDDGPASPVSPTSGVAPNDPSAANKPRKKPKRPLDESMIIAFLREKQEATTKDCIQKFQPYLREEEARKAFTRMVKNVAAAKNNVLILKEEYR